MVCEVTTTAEEDVVAGGGGVPPVASVVIAHTDPCGRLVATFKQGLAKCSVLRAKCRERLEHNTIRCSDCGSHPFARGLSPTHLRTLTQGQKSDYRPASMVSKLVVNSSTAGVLVAFVGGVYVYTMRAVSKDGIEEVRLAPAVASFTSHSPQRDDLSLTTSSFTQRGPRPPATDQGLARHESNDAGKAAAKSSKK